MSILKKIFQLVEKFFKKPVKKSSRKRLIARSKSRSKKTVARKISGSKAVSRKNGNKSTSLTKKKPAEPTAKKKQSVSKKVFQEVGKTKVLETPIGEITHYFDKIKVCVVRVDHGLLKKGDKVVIQGKEGALTQVVSSMQIENEDVLTAKKGQLVGIKVPKAVSVGATISRVNT